MTTLYWHDYETWGVDPSVDRPAQFAGVRTDLALNIIGEPLVSYCQPPDDVLPHPEACLITGIAPQRALNEGVTEREFIAAIHREMAAPGTCGVGYNSIRFDDEVTRYTLYRNFFDPYEREWKQGNSRWDIIDVVRLCYAVRPEGIEWPMVDGLPSFRLENLTAANGLAHASAHDAWSDVEATIGLARLIRERQPALFEHTFAHRTKQQCGPMLDLARRQPVLHISSRYSAGHGCAALVMPLAMHPTNKNAVVVYDLSADPGELIRLDADGIAERVFTAQADLPEGSGRIPLKLVHLNKCPILLTPRLLDARVCQRLKIDRTACENHWQQLLRQDLSAKVQQVFQRTPATAVRDPERQLYDGFLPDGDKGLMATLRNADATRVADIRPAFQDSRLREMQWRYRARNFPETLTPSEREQWWAFCQRRLTEGEDGVQTVAQLQLRIREIDEANALDKTQKIILQQLYRYSEDLSRKYQLGRKCAW